MDHSARTTMLTHRFLNNTLKNLEEINLGQPVEHLEQFPSLVLDKVDAIQSEEINAEVMTLIQELRQTNVQISGLLGSEEGLDARAYPSRLFIGEPPARARPTEPDP